MESGGDVGELVRFLSRDEVADILGISPRHLDRLTAGGVLPAKKFGRRVLIHPRDVRAYIDAAPKREMRVRRDEGD